MVDLIYLERLQSGMMAQNTNTYFNSPKPFSRNMVNYEQSFDPKIWHYIDTIWIVTHLISLAILLVPYLQKGKRSMVLPGQVVVPYRIDKPNLNYLVWPIKLTSQKRKCQRSPLLNFLEASQSRQSFLQIKMNPD